MTSTVEGSGSSGKVSNIDVISSTAGKVSNQARNESLCNSRLTELFKPFRASAIHLRNSCDGAEGVSSLGAAGASLMAAVTTGDLVGVATAGERAAIEAAVSVGVETAEAGFVAEGAVEIAGRAGTAAAGALPPEPTVVQAPPVCTGGVG